MKKKLLILISSIIMIISLVFYFQNIVYADIIVDNDLFSNRNSNESTYNKNQNLPTTIRTRGYYYDAIYLVGGIVAVVVGTIIIFVNLKRKKE